MKAIAQLQIAIDGPSGSGKGTIAQRLGESLELAVLDTGLLYRFTAWLGANEGVLDDESALLSVLHEVIADIAWNSEGLQFKDLDISKLRCEKVSQNASVVAAYPQVRESLLQRQRELAKHGCVMDGRDIGTVVLPTAQAKFFLTASTDERARRRWLQLQATNSAVRFETILSELQKRDQRDTNRRHSPLSQAEDAVLLDTTDMDIDDVVKEILEILKKRCLVIL